MTPEPSHGASPLMSAGRDPRYTLERGRHPLPETIGSHLPTPGAVSGGGGQQQREAQAQLDDWFAGCLAWRREQQVRIGYDDGNYRRPELQWAQRNFVQARIAVEERYFFDGERDAYSVDRFLDALEARYGGIDSVVLQTSASNLGIDDRNGMDHLQDLPGGLDGLRGAVDAFHARGVRVLLTTLPWDQGTRAGNETDWAAMARIVAAVGADGITSDGCHGLPRAFFDACAALGHPVVLQADASDGVEEPLLWNVQSGGRAAADGTVPPVAALKWVEPRHMINHALDGRHGHRHGLQYQFFNGIGCSLPEDLHGNWRGLDARDAECLRRIAAIERMFAAALVSVEWRPYAATLQAGIFASHFPQHSHALWTLVNRHECDIDGEQLAVPHRSGMRYYDLWNGVALVPRTGDGLAVLSFPITAHGFGAVLALEPFAAVDGLDEFIERMRERAATPLEALCDERPRMPQTLVPIADTASASDAPAGMIDIPAASFDFVVAGVANDARRREGVDVQYPWENSARREHRHRIAIRRFYIDRHPVTNAQFKRFLDASGWQPPDRHNFLRHWRDGAPVAGSERQPVRWVALEDARAYAAWAGKRLPREWEWQYAAQGDDGRRYPWGDAWREDAVPAPCLARDMRAPDDVDAHPSGASPFGVLDLVGNLWQWTDEYLDEHARAAVLRGGSLYRPQASPRYFPQALRLDRHGRYLLMAPCRDRSAAIGFRCAMDATPAA